MSTSATILTKPELYDLHVRKFRSICDMHGVQFGSHEDLRDFMHKLTEDRHFAMDFWAFTGKLSSREGGELSDARMLSVIVDGVAGGDIPDPEGELKSLVDDLAALLAGVDVQSPSSTDVQPVPFPLAEPDSQSKTDEETQSAGGEVPLRASSSPAASISEAVDREAGLASLAPASSSPRVVFISEPAKREADPAPPPPPRQSSSRRAAFTSEAADREANPAPSAPSRRSSTRATFTPEAIDRETNPAPPLPSRRSASSRAVFISEPVERELNPVISLPSTLPSSPRAISISETADREADSASSLPTQLVDALRWLQVSSLELKQHLNEIDQKMSRLDPNLEEPTSKADASKAKMRTVVEERPASSARASAAKPIPIVQDDPWPGPELLASAFGERWSQPSTPVPLENYAQTRGPHGKALFAAVLFVVAGSTFLLQQFGASLRASYGPGIQRTELVLARLLGQSSMNNSRTVARTDSEPETVSFASVEPEAISNSANQQANDTSAPSTGLSGFGRSLGQAAVTAISGGTNSNTDLSRRATSSRSESAPIYNSAQTENTPSNDASSDGGAEPINVAPAVMQANLVQSRVPAYPKAAKVDHVEGSVVMKAIISKSGAVEDVRVIEGNPLLLSAATDAVYKWRFKPYLLNGQPVRVTTTIAVDFKPKR